MADALSTGATTVLNASTPLALARRRTFVQPQSAPLTVPAEAQDQFGTALASPPGSVWRLAQPAATVLLDAQATRTPVILQQDRTPQGFALSDPFKFDAPKSAPQQTAAPAPAPTAKAAAPPPAPTQSGSASFLDIST